jgi:hypothetical protein
MNTLLNAKYVLVTPLNFTADIGKSHIILAFIHPSNKHLLSIGKTILNQPSPWSFQSGVEVSLNKWWWMLQSRLSVLAVIKVEVLGAMGALSTGTNLVFMCRD